VLRRSLDRTRDRAERLDASEAEQRGELQENQERNQLVVETCRNVLLALDRTADSEHRQNEK
jgi:hypothetical protein